MSDFSTEGAVQLVAEERALRQLRDDVEDALGDIQVGVDAGGAGAGGGRPPEMRSDGGSGGGRERRRARREHRWARQRTDDIEDLLEVVRGLDGDGGGDGGLLGDLLGAGGGALAGAIPAGAGAAIGAAVGPAVAEAISDSELSVDDLGEEPDWVPIEVEEPEWSIDVDEPDDSGDWWDIIPDPRDIPSLAVPDIDPVVVRDPSPLDVREPVLDVDDPSPLEVSDTLVPLEVSDTQLPLAVSDTRLPLAVEEVGEIPVEEPTEIPVEDVGPIEVLLSVDGDTVASDDTTRSRETETGTINDDDAFQRGIRQVPIVGGLVGDIDAELRGMDTVHTTPSDPESRHHFQTRHTGPDSENRSQSGHSVSVTATEPAQVETDVSPRIDINVDTDRMVREILDGFDDAIEDVRQDLEREIEDVADDLDDLERDIRS